MTSNQIENDIHSLDQTLKDSLEGYQRCASDVSDSAAQQKFRELAQRRQQMLDEFERVAAQINKPAQTSGSTLASAHRLYVDLKSLLTGGDRGAIIHEIERGENYLISQYQDILGHGMPEPLKGLLQKQVKEVQSQLEQVRQFYRV